MNVVFFVTKLDSGGIENYLLRFLTEYHNRFDKIFVWCKSGKDGQIDNLYTSLENVELVKVELGYFSLFPYRVLGRFLATHKVDVVCDFTGNFSGRTLVSAAKAGVANRISAYRGSSDHFQNDPFRNIYNRWVRSLTLKNSTNIISNSKAAFNFFFPGKWENDKRFSVIYNGINPVNFVQETGSLREQFGIPEEAFVVGHTGRFNKAKNHEAIISVAQKLVCKYPDIYFILCGNGVRSNLFGELKVKNLEGKVLVFENRNDIPCFLNSMDCYFFPSVTEGQPNSLIEAMIVGLPFVASDISPIRETVGDNYVLYPPQDVKALSDAIEAKYLAREKRDLALQKEMVDRFGYRVRFEEFYRVLSE